MFAVYVNNPDMVKLFLGINEAEVNEKNKVGFPL
jgi:hypothetical protein